MNNFEKVFMEKFISYIKNNFCNYFYVLKQKETFI